MLYYIRDDNNNLIGFKTNNTTYYYKKNYQNDIIGIYDNNYNLIVSYEYDDYGSILSIKDNTGIEITDPNHIGNLNPFRYRSYYYDKETNLYYLNSRYYNPEWGRFINADSIIGTKEDHVGYNLYSYCENNPTNSLDSNGMINWKKVGEKVSSGAKAVGKAIGGAVGYLFGGVASGISSLAGVVLGYPNAGEMFGASFSGGEKAVKQSIQNDLGPQMKNSKEVKTAVDSQVNTQIKGNAFNTCYNTSVEFNDRDDLNYAVGKANITTSVMDMPGHYFIQVRISDTYDFDGWREKKNFGSIMNNVGYILQKSGVIKPYNWDYSYGYIIKK